MVWKCVHRNNGSEWLGDNGTVGPDTPEVVGYDTDLVDVEAGFATIEFTLGGHLVNNFITKVEVGSALSVGRITENYRFRSSLEGILLDNNTGIGVALDIGLYPTRTNKSERHRAAFKGILS